MLARRVFLRVLTDFLYAVASDVGFARELDVTGGFSGSQPERTKSTKYRPLQRSATRASLIFSPHRR